MHNKTPWNPSRRAIARVKDPLPVPTEHDACGGGDVELVGNEKIYGRPFGEWPWAYRCTKCGAYVGLHPFTAIPLGTLADAATREARTRAKAAFNPLWRSKSMRRSEAYEWLAGKLGIALPQCHIGWFDIVMCHRVLEVCREWQRAREAA